MSIDQAKKLNSRGNALAREGYLDEAITAYRQALEQDPKHALAHNNLANALKEQGQLQASIDHYRRAAELAPDRPEIQLNLGLAVAQLRLLDRDCDAAMATLVALKPADHPERRFYLAMARKLAGDNKGAADDLREALRRRPLYPHATSAGSGPRVLLTYSTDRLDFEPMLDGGVSFEVRGGHFSAPAFLARDRYRLHNLWVSDSREFQEAVRHLAGFDVIVNTIADPEINARALGLLNDALVDIDVPVINRPQQVLDTTRQAISHRLQEIPGVVSPRTQQVRGSADLKAWAGTGLGLPALVRPLGSSTGIGLEKISSIPALQDRIDRLGGRTINLCPFVDFASPDGLYRKYRVFVIDGNVLPEHCVICDDWNVHSSSRMKLMRASATLRQEEQRFVQDPWTILSEAHLEAIRRIHASLGLDYFGIDFTIASERELLVFEANAGMRINPDYLSDFPYLAAPIEQIKRACNQMLLNRVTAR
ncbi:MAG: tetratricopeptide repeat protein [Phycisphaerae bacterium]|nr:tetratricopeptide repeat protein [Phycisphaerae bacterium]